MLRKTSLLSFSLLLLITDQAVAQVEPASPTPDMETDRPDQTEASSVIPWRSFQLETGFEVEKDKSGSSEQRSFMYPAGLVRYGLLPNLELRLILEYHRVEVRNTGLPEQPNQTLQGLNPVAIGTKIYICPEAGLRPEMAFIGHMHLPVSSADFKIEHAAPAFRFSFSHTLSDRAGLGYNAGYEWTDGPGAGKFIYTLALGYDLAEKWGLYGEVYGEDNSQKTMQHLFDGGLTFSPNPNLQFDVSAGVGLTNNAPDRFVGCGLSFRVLR